MPKDAPLAVEVPASGRDKPGWIKVGVIAAVGFVVGIAWPRLLGVRLGPAAPGTTAAASASATGQGGRAPEAPPAILPTAVAKAAPAASVAPAASAAPSSADVVPSAAPAPPSVSVRRGSVLSCKTSGGDTLKGKECGAVKEIDQLVTPRLRKLATCSGLAGQSGKLSVVVNADFDAARFSYDVGKSTNLANVDPVRSCLETAFHGASTKSTPHTHPRYAIAYTAMIGPGADGELDAKSARKARRAAGEDKSERAAKQGRDEKGEREERPVKRADLASGEAEIAWEVALVRDTPKTGSLVGRLARGTKVKVGAAKDGWYLVKFGGDFAREGWLYRGAIGR